MGTLTDRLVRLAVTTRSPDGNIEADARGGSGRVEVRFAPGGFRGYTEPELGHQLAELGARIWTRYLREHAEVVESFLGEPAKDEEENGRRFRDRLERLTASGASAGGWLEVRSRALVRWEVAIRPGALRALTEQDFLAEFDSAVSDMLADYRTQVIFLTDEIYDIGLPRLRRHSAVRLAPAVDGIG